MKEGRDSGLTSHGSPQLAFPCSSSLASLCSPTLSPKSWPLSSNLSSSLTSGESLAWHFPFCHPSPLLFWSPFPQSVLHPSVVVFLLLVSGASTDPSPCSSSRGAPTWDQTWPLLIFHLILAPKQPTQLHSSLVDHRFYSERFLF